jgi:hypothetical protein
VASADGSSPAKGRAALTVAAATAENTKNTMITGTTNLLTAAMVSSFSLRVLSLFRLLSPRLGARASFTMRKLYVCFDTLIAGPKTII